MDDADHIRELLPWEDTRQTAGEYTGAVTAVARMAEGRLHESKENE
jgi:hypothetical protein